MYCQGGANKIARIVHCVIGYGYACRSKVHTVRIADGGGEEFRGGRGEHELQVAVLDEPLQHRRPRRRLVLVGGRVELELAVTGQAAVAVHHVLFQCLVEHEREHRLRDAQVRGAQAAVERAHAALAIRAPHHRPDPPQAARALVPVTEQSSGTC